MLDNKQQAVFERYIQAGGGFVGVHAATDCEYNWPWYGKLVGAYFQGHPKQQTAKLIVNDNTHPSTNHLPAVWERYDEWYNFKKAPGNVIVAVVGAGHVPGIQKHIQNENSLEAISVIPPKSIVPTIIKWAIPVAIIALLVIGFFILSLPIMKNIIVACTTFTNA